MLENCGHFPVHFNSSKLGSFSVDKEAQAEVQAQMEAHIDAGGAISLFPEGQVNRADYRTLQSFRRGSMAIAKNLVGRGGAVYGFLMVGVTEAWPTAESLPSHGADVRYKLFKVQNVDLTLELPEFTNSIERQMQAEMDTLVAAASAEKAKKAN